MNDRSICCEFINTQEELVYIHRIVLYIVAFTMSATVYQHNYGAINIDDPNAEVFYVVQLMSII